LLTITELKRVASRESNNSASGPPNEYTMTSAHLAIHDLSRGPVPDPGQRPRSHCTAALRWLYPGPSWNTTKWPGIS
jgi:hypothetical protein